MLNYVYLEVSNDKYELPVVVADNLKELSEKTGVKTTSISTMLSKYENGHLEKCKYRKVAIEESEEN